MTVGTEYLDVFGDVSKLGIESVPVAICFVPPAILTTFIGDAVGNVPRESVS